MKNHPIYEEIAPFAYVSYSHLDKELICPILRQIQIDSYRFWCDEGIYVDKKWDETIAEKIDTSEIFLALITDNYLESGNCKDELNYARDLNKEILLIFLQDITPSGNQAIRMGQIPAIFKSKYQCEKDFYTELYSLKALNRCHSSKDSTNNYLIFSLNKETEEYEVEGVKDRDIEEIIIPSSYQEKPVTSIANHAFCNCEDLTSVILPDTIKTIGANAFAYCKVLTSIIIPDSVVSIDRGAFGGTELISITTPCFNEARTADDHLGYIFGAYSFSDNGECVPPSLKTVILTKGTQIAPYAFNGCKNLTSITIPDSIISIGKSAFSDCDSLTSITLPDSIASIGEYAFNNCKSLTSVTIPNNVTSIGKAVFGNCDSLTSITIPDSVTSICACAFEACTSLTSVTIGNAVTAIDDYAFNGCTNLTSLTVKQGNPKHHSAGNCLIETAAKTLAAGCKSSVIPTDGSVITIKDRAFRGCEGLTAITIPDGVTSIGSNAFAVCTGLTSITIPDSVASIGYGAFSACTSLTTITIPNSVTNISKWLFAGCAGLTSIIISNSVTNIGEYAFERCENLTTIHYNGTMEEWNAISKGNDWNYNTGKYTVYCTDGNLMK